MKRFYISRLILLIAILSTLSSNVLAQTTTFIYTGAVQTYTVPAGVTSIAVDAQGAIGGQYSVPRGGYGGRVQCTMNVTPLTVYYIYIGGAGGTGTAGFNGGGVAVSNAGGGGGATDMRTVNGPPTTTNRPVVAGGGGGGTANYGTANYDRGGNGGGLTGEQGYTDNVHSVGGTQAGAMGGGPSGGGVGGTQPGYGAGATGTVGVGGAGASGTWGPGGGGGYYGGGGGSWDGGGGGSSYTDPVLVTAVSHTQGANITAPGNGSMVITVLCNAPGTITGNNPVCAGSTLALSDPIAVPGGTWSSNNSLVASIDPGSGLINGIAQGTATITYSIPNPCGALATAIVTVNPVPAPIGSPSSICTGALTTLTETSLSGTWSSSNTSAATIDAFGNVLGLTIGGTTISYILPGGCFATQALTVNIAPGPITGDASICQGATTLLSDAIGGGTWASTSGGVANVDPVGHVSGIGTAGVVTSTAILYTLSNGCSVSRIVTVNPLPSSSFTVSGNSSFCPGTLSTQPIILVGSAAGISYQLFNGSVATGAPITGGFGALNFGIPTSAGLYTVVGTNIATGCVNTMISSATVSEKTIPSAFPVTGGGSYCQGDLGLPVGLSSSSNATKYQLLLNGLPLPIPQTIDGNGGPINFTLQAAPGDYTVVATTNSGLPNCVNNMTGNVSIIVNAVPDPENVIGGGTYCAGGDGVSIGLDFSNPGIYYQLNDGGTIVDTVVGTGDMISFGLQMDPSSGYSVSATNIATGCSSNMTGTASINVASLPNPFTVTGGGTGCVGTSYSIGLETSDPGINYQLYKGVNPIGSFVAGVSGPVDFGVFTDSGTYTVIGTDQVFGCTGSMNNPVTIIEQPLPVIYNATGGGSYCAGGLGLPVMLSGSQSGVTYYLYKGATPVTSLPGTGDVLNFDVQPLGGSYTVVAVDQGTFCTSNMSGSVAITVDPVPTIYNIRGGGSYCDGSAGIDLRLDFSTPGISYQLFNSGSPAGSSMPGTGDSIDFGYFTPAGNYTIVATNPATSCQSNMSGSATITINLLPFPQSVSGGGSYCIGDAGKLVTISGSESGIKYQLYNGGASAIGTPVAGTGSSFDFGLQTLGGTYTVIATDTITSCATNMPGVATIVVNPLPGSFSVTGGGMYCEGGAGMHIGLSGSNAGVHYVLSNGSTPESSLTGSGALLDFGPETVPGTYTIVATNTTTGCQNTMAGNAVIAANAAPAAYSVIGGGSYCTGSSTIPSVGLSSSNAGINYQLYRTGVASGSSVPGTGAAIDFGAQTLAGAYTIIATDAFTGCTKNMSGSAAVAVGSMPSVYTVAGGGNYCIGGSGYHIYMSNTNPGIQYQLFNGSAAVSTVLGTGAGVDFGLMPLTGTYTAVATNLVSGCTANMAGSAAITISSLPAVHNVTVSDGGSYCITGTGVHVGLNGSDNGINYQLFNGTIPAGTVFAGTGGAIDLGMRTAGSYTVVGTNAATGCTSNMTGSAVVTAIPLPDVYGITGGGNYCTTGIGLHVGLGGSDAGTMYQLYRGAAAIGSPVTGTSGPIDFGLFTNAGSYTVAASNTGAVGCNNNMSGNAVITVYPVVVPTVSIDAAGGDTACSGIPAHFTASSVNGGVSPLYNWSVNGTSLSSGATFSYSAVDGDMVTVLVHSNGVCAIPDTASQTIRMTVSIPQAPSVHISATPGNIVCQGTMVTYTGATMFSGSHPDYAWIKNGVYVVGTGATYSYTPADNDVIVLLMGSSFPCRLLDSVFSNTITMEVDSSVIPTLTISANPGTQIAPGQSVTLTAIVGNGVPGPSYQWRINGAIINGATNASYSSANFSNNDSISCEVTGSCGLKGFNSVVMSVGTEGVQQITVTGNNNVKLVPNPNKGAFIIKGALASPGDEEAFIEVTNMLGQVVYSGRAMTQNGIINERIQLSGVLANGMYILNLRSGSQNSVFHFVIEQ